MSRAFNASVMAQITAARLVELLERAGTS